MNAVKKLSLADVFGAPIKRLRPFKLQPRRATGRMMRTKQFAEGTIHYSSFRAAYMEPPPKIGQRRVLNAHGALVTGHFQIPQPWKRVTPKAVRPGAARRAEARA